MYFFYYIQAFGGRKPHKSKENTHTKLGKLHINKEYKIRWQRRKPPQV